MNIDAAPKRDPWSLLRFNEVLNRLKTFTGLLQTKFVGANVDELLTPEDIIKPEEFHSAADYQLIRILAFHANYQFNDDKLPFDHWMKRILESK